MNRALRLTLGSILLAGFSMASHAVLIDDFNGGPVYSVPPAPLPTPSCDNDQGFVATGMAIGGGRKLSCDSSLGTVNYGLLSPFNGLIGVLDYQSQASSRANSLVVWDADGAGLGGVDLTEMGAADQFVFTVAALDAGADLFSFTLTVEGAGATVWSFTGTSGTRVTSLFFAPFPVPFSGPGVAIGSDLAALASAETITLDITANGFGVDYALDKLETTVPVPGTVALLGLGLLGVGAVRRKKLSA